MIRSVFQSVRFPVSFLMGVRYSKGLELGYGKLTIKYLKPLVIFTSSKFDRLAQGLK